MEIKERIREKAFEMFMRFGIRSVSMDEIAGQLGMSKKTLYQHFADKEELINDVVLHDIMKDEQDCREACGQSANAVEEIFRIMGFVLEQLRNMNPVVLFDLQKFHPGAYAHFEKHKNEFMLNIVRANIERGLREELYRPELDIDIISKFRLESMFIPFNMDVFPSGKYNVAAITQEIMEHFVYGVATPKGYKLIQKYKKELIINK
ncbi:MAG: TetR family transcriptional regulator [Terrimonas sp.]|nr:TetR family transcriptional regulator [Terrimonas sp.]